MAEILQIYIKNKIDCIMGDPGIDCGQSLKDYLWNEFKFNVHPKYYKYFEEWYNNLTENQILYYTAYSKGLKSPYL